MTRVRLPVDHPDAPKYWLYETSGVLVPAMYSYLNGDPLTRSDVRVIKAYLAQWIGSPVWDGTDDSLAALRADVAAIASQVDIHDCIVRAVGMGMDPL